MTLSTIQRCFKPPQQSYFLFGPRGTGKSTMLKTHYADALWIDLLQPEQLRSYAAHPERLKDLVLGNPQCKQIVIDEVQKAPAMLSVVHALIEEKRGLQFILSGSSARKLKHTSADLLGGRALKRELYPFMATELGNNFSLDQALRDGLLPLILQASHPQDVLQAYINLYLQEEIQAEGLVRNLDNFARFLEVISFSHGSLLNVTNIARDCVVKRKTVESYIDILEELLLAFRLPVFTRRAERDLSAHPKFYLFDAGVFQALRPKGPLDRVEEISGAALEGLVAQHLKAWIDYSIEKLNLYFWRTRSGVEVDFVIYGAAGLWAIEVKNSQRVHASDTKALETFKQDYPIAHTLLLYRGSEKIRYGNVLCLPCSDFLRGIQPGKSLPVLGGSSIIGDI